MSKFTATKSMLSGYSIYLRMSSRLQRFIQKWQTSEMECFTKINNEFQLLTVFAKYSSLDVWQGSEYASGLRKLLCRGFKRYTLECLIYAKLIIVLTPSLQFSRYSGVIYGSEKFKIKEK